MSAETVERLFGWWTALDQPLVLVAVGVITIVFAKWAAIVPALRRWGGKDAAAERAYWKCWRGSILWTALVVVPILLGAAWVIAGVAGLSVLCYREFARATGLFREKMISVVVVLGIAALTFASADNYARLYFALAPLIVGLVAVVTIPQDRPKGYIQRTALGVLGFLLLGHGLGYLGLLANFVSYRSLLVLVLVGVGMNDMIGFAVAKKLKGPQLLPNTSTKTVAASAAALLLTTPVVAGLSHFALLGTAADRVDVVLLLGAGMNLLSQFGELLFASLKRDLGIAELERSGLLERVAGLVLVPPALFHFLSLHLGPLNATSAEWIFTGR